MAKAPLSVFKWEAPEFRHYPKNPAWYITMFIVVGLLIAYQIILGDWFGAVSLIILGIIISFFARQTPKHVEMEISDQGIHISGDLIPYNRIKHFWIIDDHEHKVLNIETTAYLNHQLAIELEDEDADEIREFLIDILPEHSEIEPTSAQKIAHRFKF
ncbi:TPA: hypothetical protein DCG61_01200 [Patescibacteria group bacterium]|jgi:hypothetical protein|nr:hypothetical protein [Patescibacteria group bacterium]